MRSHKAEAIYFWLRMEKSILAPALKGGIDFLQISELLLFRHPFRGRGKAEKKYLWKHCFRLRVAGLRHCESFLRHAEFISASLEFRDILRSTSIRSRKAEAIYFWLRMEKSILAPALKRGIDFLQISELLLFRHPFRGRGKAEKKYLWKHCFGLRVAGFHHCESFLRHAEFISASLEFRNILGLTSIRSHKAEAIYFWLRMEKSILAPVSKGHKESH